MGLKKDVIDIATEIGGIRNIKDAYKMIEGKTDAANMSKINKIKNQDILIKIANAISF